MSLRRRPQRTDKEKVLAQWRRYWEPQDLSEHEWSISHAVANTVGGLGLKDRFNEEQIFEAWNELVSGFIAQNAKPVALNRKVLSIQVLHSTVFYELERMKGTLLKKMQERFGDDAIREIRFRLG